MASAIRYGGIGLRARTRTRVRPAPPSPSGVSVLGAHDGAHRRRDHDAGVVGQPHARAVLGRDPGARQDRLALREQERLLPPAVCSGVSHCSAADSGVVR